MLPISFVCHDELEHMLQIVIELDMLHCSWNSIRILNIVSFMELDDTTLKGRIVNASVGKDAAGSFFCIRGALYSADGEIEIYS